MITDPTRALEWMIGLPAVVFLGAKDGEGGQAKIHLETTASVVGCPTCGVLARVMDRSGRRAGRPPALRAITPR